MDIKENKKYRTENIHYDEKYSNIDNKNQIDSITYKYFDFYYINKFLKSHENAKQLAGASVLIACAGFGNEISLFKKAGMIVSAMDYSKSSCEYIRSQYPDINVFQGDFLNLLLPDKSFDYVFINKSLHHLDKPIMGIYEMERLSRKGFFFIEAQDSYPMKFISKYIIGEYESTGTYNYRFTKREIEKYLRSLNKNYELVIETSWYHPLKFFRNRVYPFFDKFNFFRNLYICFHDIVNFFIGRCGNNFYCYVRHKD